MKRVSGIYTITNKVNGKIYLGMSINIKSRWHGHRSSLKSNCHPNIHLQNSYNKYGVDNFQYEILEEIEDKEVLPNRELELIKSLNLTNPKFGYNRCDEKGAVLSKEELLNRRLNFAWMRTKQRIENSGMENICLSLRNMNSKEYTYEEIDLISDLCNLPEEIVEAYCTGKYIELDSLKKEDKLKYSRLNPVQPCFPCNGCSRFLELDYKNGICFCSHLRINFNTSSAYVNNCRYKVEDDGDMFKEVYGNDTTDEITTKWLNGEIV